MVKKQAIESGFARIYGAQAALPKAQLVSVECDITKGLHAFTIVGLPDKAIEEAKDRVAAAIKNTDLESPKKSNKKIVFSLAPAELKKEGAAFDVPVALAFLLASEQVAFTPAGKLFAGELALDGSVRAIRGTLSIAILARDEGIDELYVPAANAEEAALVSGLRVYPVRSLTELIAHLANPESDPISPYTRRAAEPQSAYASAIDLADIRGQESAKRALEVAIAGGHNIALYGPPGTGKTMLARAACALLPQLAEAEMLEVTAIHSLAGTLSGGAMRMPPFRAPHHTSSYPSLIGGGAIPRPGEVTLAHRGLLFLDEFAEFHSDVINALREPLEDGRVSVARARGSATFPANFILIAALNPCPCGKYGTRECLCAAHAIERYRRKLSGPVADRIDIWVQVGELPPEILAEKRTRVRPESEAARGRIEKARGVQAARFAGRPLSLNSDMGARDIESLAQLDADAEKSLISAAKSLKLSPRGYHRTIKVARTIADLADSPTIETPHMLEALQYRSREA